MLPTVHQGFTRTSGFSSRAPGLSHIKLFLYIYSKYTISHKLQLHFHPFINFLFSCYTRYLSIHIFYYRNSSLFTTSGLTLLIMTHLCVFLYVNLKPRPVSDFPFPLFSTNHAHSKFLSNHTIIV